MKRSDPIIGQPVHRHVREAIRHEAFIARWRPVYELAEAFVTPVIVLLGSLLVLAMLSSFVIAIATHRLPA